MKLHLLVCFIFLVGFVFAQNVSFNEVQSTLENSAKIINELSVQGFNVDYANDSYSEALLVFQQVNYAEVLRNNAIPETDSRKLQARAALRLVNWKNVSYSNVLYYADLISQYKTDSYELFDSINALNKKAIAYSLRGANVSVSEGLIVSANTSFYKGQFKESFVYIEQAKLQLESDFEQISTLNVMASNAKNFFYRYLYWIIFFVVLISLIAYFSAGYFRVKFLKSKIIKLEMEERVLNSLIIKTQNERYKENKISELVYNIRVRKYQSRLEEIKQDLPVLKKRLHK